jgi:hypothetical protein
MQFRVRKGAHVLERLGLAMAGASCGLFVAAHVGSSIAALTSQGFLVVMMIVGAIGFYDRSEGSLQFWSDDCQSEETGCG